MTILIGCGGRALDAAGGGGPRLGVSVAYAGALAAEVERAIARPLEEALRALDGVEDVRAASFDGAAEVRVAFRAEVAEVDAAARVQQAVGATSRFLPPDATMPVVRRLGDVERWVLVDAPRLDPDRAFALGERLRLGLERVPGVRGVERCGDGPIELRVVPDPARLAAFGIGAAEVRAALERARTDEPVGRIRASAGDVAVRVDGREEPSELEQLVVATRDGVPVRMRDVARLERARSPGACRVAGATLALVVDATREVTDAALGDRAKELVADVPEAGASATVVDPGASGRAVITWARPR